MAMIDVSRHVNLKTLTLKVKVLTPMFLGGADGNAELRPAPFKAAMRYWWRITQPEQQFTDLLKTEQTLFGGIVNEKSKDLSPCKGKVSVRVSGPVNVDYGETNFETNKTIKHPEVKTKKGEIREINSLAYLGMGPIFWNKNKFQMEYKKSRIIPGSEFNLNLSFPSNNHDFIKAISLFHHFGGIGGRNRNSWGSLAIISDELLSLKKLINDPQISRPFDECFKVEYPTAVPYDRDGILVWHTTHQNSPFDAMHELAKLYVLLRIHLIFSKGMTQDPEERHILGYPVTNHKVKKWEPEKEFEIPEHINNPKRMMGRLPSQLRFKVMQNHEGLYLGRILHIACKLPKRSQWNIDKQKKIWAKVHEFLDEKMERVTISGRYNND